MESNTKTVSWQYARRRRYDTRGVSNPHRHRYRPKEDGIYYPADLPANGDLIEVEGKIGVYLRLGTWDYIITVDGVPNTLNIRQLPIKVLPDNQKIDISDDTLRRIKRQYVSQVYQAVEIYLKRVGDFERYEETTNTNP